MEYLNRCSGDLSIKLSHLLFQCHFTCLKNGFLCSGGPRSLENHRGRNSPSEVLLPEMTLSVPLPLTSPRLCSPLQASFRGSFLCQSFCLCLLVCLLPESFPSVVFCCLYLSSLGEREIDGAYFHWKGLQTVKVALLAGPDCFSDLASDS